MRFDTLACLSETAEKLRDALRSIELHGDGEHGSTLAELARISLALTSANAELRQHQKAERREVAAIPIELVIAHLKTLPNRTRQRIARELSGVDQEGPLL